ncbi:MAG: septal ring lytic transglycosylase RlpA family protein [Aquificota bacterium]|nr:septal ring lytic transglycosylase RlpA family protein [Aquificota bacterium]
MWVVFLIALVLSCAPKVKVVDQVQVGKLKAKCPKVVYMKVTYCPTRYAYSDRIQHMSLIKVVSLDTGRSIRISVRTNRKVKGLCIPKRYRRFMSRGEVFTAKVRVLRCGENGVSTCPVSFRGYASWYGRDFHGRRTASGVRFNMYDYVAAHRTLPLGTILLVRNLKNGKTVRVKVVDRGPYVRGRHLDLSYAAAKRIGMIGDGVVPFEAKVIRCGF